MGEARTSDRSQTEQQGHRRRVTVAEAAELLGITAEAVRTRIKRGKLDSVKDPPLPGGTVYVLLEADQTRPNADPTSQGQDQTADQTGPTVLLEAKDETIAELRARVESLERQLDARQEEIRRRDILLAQMVERVPQLEPPQEPPESPLVPQPSIKPERAEPAEPADPERAEPERAEPERVEPERVEPEKVETERVESAPEPRESSTEAAGGADR